jgi:hypothetical protein
MTTAYDWITVLLFAALATLFLQRSVGRAVAGDRALAYLPPALGCAGSNVLGNTGWHLAAWLLLGATIAYIVLRLRPWASD